jgi:type VI secretion system protein ImpG
MADELLPYYEKELAYIRQMGAEFAKEHPKIAGRLGISSDIIEDPHVSRLVESFAYLNARVHHKLDDDFPELSDALLNVIFPHYQRPLPSMSVVQFNADKEQLDGRFSVPRETLLETEQFQGENCRFSTTYPVDLWPVEVSEATLVGRPFSTPGATSARGAAGVLKVVLKTFTKSITFSDLSIENLRFYLRGQPQHIHPLYELMLNNAQSVVLAAGESDLDPTYIGKESIKAVGFGSDEGLLPYPPASFIGYRLLTEYFVFPEKFMFVDIQNLQASLSKTIGNELHLYIYLDQTDIELENNVSASTFALGCTPAINLFKHTADPIKVDHTQAEYPVVPDCRRPSGYEVYSIDKVTASDSSGQRWDYLPLYGLTHGLREDDDQVFWCASRRPAKLGVQRRDEGTDMYLSLVDLNFNPSQPDDRTLSIETQCSNRDLPAKLPFNLNHPKLQCVHAAPPCDKIRFLAPPTGTVRPPLRNGARWRLISHLNLNHLSITGGANAVESLKEILRLYDFRESSVTRAVIDSIHSVSTRSVSAPLNIDGRATLCRGVEVTVCLDETYLSGSSRFLFASILEHFFGLYCSLNSFTRVLVTLKNREGFLKKCPPRAGEKILL